MRFRVRTAQSLGPAPSQSCPSLQPGVDVPGALLRSAGRPPYGRPLHALDGRRRRMSDLNQINAALERLFHEGGQRIVFWNDPDKEFQNTLPFLLLDGVTMLCLDQVGCLEAKI